MPQQNKSLQQLVKDFSEQVTKFSVDGKIPTDVFLERTKHLEFQVDMLIEQIFSNEEDGIVSYRLQDGSLIQSNVKDLMSFLPEFGKKYNNIWDVEKFQQFVISRITTVYDHSKRQSKPAVVLIMKKGAGIL